MLMYPYGAPSVKCAVCQYVTNVGVSMIDLIFIKETVAYIWIYFLLQIPEFFFFYFLVNSFKG